MKHLSLAEREMIEAYLRLRPWKKHVPFNKTERGRIRRKTRLFVRHTTHTIQPKDSKDYANGQKANR